uniref:Mitotic spindle assembly checkpoint protein MAD2B-like isoform X1 n=1 Tax=Tanacetum cinerariifolium TaxID=118510 RepID=A0A699H2E5_TANCI|nr:mitotic spindle assembly checkpoint protein MAD2B-like isoform X1 [Tanacetum cinerariifolium]
MGGIAELDADEDVTLVDAKKDVNADVHGRLVESQAKVYHLDLQHAVKVLSMQDTDEAEPAKVEEVIEVVIVAKLMTKVVTTAATTITAAQVPKASAPRRMRGVVIQDPEETATASVIEEAFARQLEAEMNDNINWNDVLEQVLVVDYQIHHEHNKPYYKIIKEDGTHQLFLSFITLLKNFDREDLEMLWKLVQERFQSSEPKKFLDDFLLNTLKIMFKNPNMILLVEKKYHLTRFILEQMLNNVRLEVKEESEMSLELLSWNATYDNLLGTNKPFSRPIPLPEMVNFLVDIWEQEGLYD